MCVCVSVCSTALPLLATSADDEAPVLFLDDVERAYGTFNVLFSGDGSDTDGDFDRLPILAVDDSTG